MILPHNCYITAKTVSDCIQAATADDSTEVNLAVSNLFFGYEGDLDVSDRYSDYFRSAAKQICEVLGDQIYMGRWDDPSYSEWNSILAEDVDAVELVVWNHGDRILYLRYGWEDTELPIVVAIGLEDAEPNYGEYPA